jgi:hypothetical protein
VAETVTEQFAQTVNPYGSNQIHHGTVRAIVLSYT